MVDTNCSPQGVSHVIPGNDDAIRSINLYCELVSKAVIDGMTTQMGEVGVDIGSLPDGPEGSSMLPAEEKNEEEKSAEESAEESVETVEEPSEPSGETIEAVEEKDAEEKNEPEEQKSKAEVNS